MRRFAESPVHSSLLTVPAAVAVDSVGFDPVGEVMGSGRDPQSGWTGTGGCGYYSPTGCPVAAKVHGSSSQWGGFGPYIKAVLERLSDGVEPARRRSDGDARRWDRRYQTRDRPAWARTTTSTPRSARPFEARSRVRPEQAVHDRPRRRLTSPTLLIGGWVPVALEIAMEMAIRHDDAFTAQQERRSYGVAGRTSRSMGRPSWRSYVRTAVRQNGWRPRSRHSRAGGLGRVERSTFNIWASGGAGHIEIIVAEARIFGTSIASFRRRRQAAAGAADRCWSCNVDDDDGMTGR